MLEPPMPEQLLEPARSIARHAHPSPDPAELAVSNAVMAAQLTHLEVTAKHSEELLAARSEADTREAAAVKAARDQASAREAAAIEAALAEAAARVSAAREAALRESLREAGHRRSAEQEAAAARESVSEERRAREAAEQEAAIARRATELEVQARQVAEREAQAALLTASLLVGTVREGTFQQSTWRDSMPNRTQVNSSLTQVSPEESVATKFAQAKLAAAGGESTTPGGPTSTLTVARPGSTPGYGVKPTIEGPTQPRRTEPYPAAVLPVSRRAIVALVLAIAGIVIISLPMAQSARRQMRRGLTRGRPIARLASVISLAWICAAGYFGYTYYQNHFTPIRADDGSISRTENIAASDLRAGDCISVDAGTTVTSQVPVTPCMKAHNAQIFAIQSLPATASFPGITTFNDQVTQLCAAKQAAFMGQNKAPMTLAALTPTTAQWTSGWHGGACYLMARHTVTGDIRAAK